MRYSSQPIRRTSGVMLAAMACALGASAPLVASERTPQPTASDAVVAEEFAAAFAPFVKPKASLEAFPGAVDIRRIEPQIEGESASGQVETGSASFYGRRFHGRLTASGTRFDMNALTAAHPHLPFGTQVRVTNLRNGRSVIVTITDRGPYAKSRIIDLSRAAAKKIGMIRLGHARVRVEVLDG